MMADQIKNQNAGEVSSPTPAEKTSAPARKEPTFAEPPKRKEPNFNAGGEDFSGEAMPEKNLPTFKTEQDKPERKEPVFKPKERKLPTFADEVKQHEDDETLDDDFTSDSVSMPFTVEGAEAVAPIVTVNAEAEANEGKKRKRNKKAKKEKEGATPTAESDTALSGNMDQVDELSLMSGTMPSVVPFGSAGYDPATQPYVPSYDAENAIMARHASANFAEPEPMPEYVPEDAVGQASSPMRAPASNRPIDPGIAEANALLADNKAERKNRKNAKNNSKAQDNSQPQSVSESASEKSEAPAENKAEAGNTPVGQPVLTPVSGKPVDPGIEEAAALLAAAKEEKARIKALKAAKRDNKSEAPAVVVETAAADAPATDNVPVATPVAAVDNTPASEPLTKKEASTSAYDKKKDKKSEKADLKNQSSDKNVKAEEAPAAKEAEAEHPDAEPYVAPAKAAAPEKAPKAPKETSTAGYDAKNQKALDKKDLKDKNRAKREALAVVYGEEKAKEMAPAPKEDAEAAARAVVYGDAEPYEAPKKAAPAVVEKTPKHRPDVAPNSYSAAEQKKIERQEAKAEKKAEKQALLEVAAAEKQKAKEDKAAEKANKPSSTPVVATVYGDTEAYNAPGKSAPTSIRKATKQKADNSPEIYSGSQQKKLDKQEAKAEKKAEKEALLAVAAAEKQKAKEDKAAEKANKPAPSPAPTPVYADTEAYDAPAKETPVKENAPKTEKEISTVPYDKRLDKKEAKAEKKADKKDQRSSMLSDNKANKPVKAEKPAPAPAEETVYSDGNYEEGYDPSAFEKAPVVKDNSSKAEKKAAKEEAKNEAAVSAYEKAKDKKQNRAAVAAALVAFYNGNKPVKKTAEREEPVTEADKVYPDADYDTGYDPNWAANEKAAEDARRASEEEAKRLEKQDAKAANGAKRDSKSQAKYETHEEKVLREREQRDELLLTYKEEIAREKAAKAAAKAATRKSEPNATETADIVYSDYTETFDKDAYEADKKLEEDAKAKSALENATAKADKRALSASKEENKILSDYDKAVGKEIARMEKAAEMLALEKLNTKEEKDNAAKARALDKAEAKAKKGLTESDDVIYPDYTETFDEDLYNATREAEAEAKAADELARRDAKHSKSVSRHQSADEKATEYYDKVRGKNLAELEKHEEMLALAKADKKEQKEKEAKEKATIKAARRFDKGLAESDDLVYDDYTETFDEALYTRTREDELEAFAAREFAKREAKLAKTESRAQTKDEKAIEYYDKVRGKNLAELEKQEEMLALAKADKKEEKERAKKALLAEKAVLKAEKSLVPVLDMDYDDYPETFDKELYNSIRQSEKDAEDAKLVAAHEKHIQKTREKRSERENKLITDYDNLVYKNRTAMAEEKEMLDLVKKDNKETKERAKREKKQLEKDMLAAIKRAESDTGLIYPDPEYLPDEFDEKFLDLTLPESGDVVVGSVPRITTVQEIRRAERENNELAMLIKKDKKRLKKLRYDTETLKLAEKYTDSGALEMADAKTVMKDAKQMRREELDLQAVKEYEKDLNEKEMLYFMQDYDTRLKTNKRRLKRAKKYGKFMLEYGSTYDPEWDGDFNNYGLPEVHPYTEGVKLARSRRRTPKKERLSYFDKKKLSALSREQCATDNKMIEARVQYNYTMLQLEVSRVQDEFSGEYRTTKEKRWLRDSKAKLKNLKARIASATKFEKLDNERYYSVVATNFEKVDLPAKADREELIAMREELMRLLDIRDDINTQLLEIYSGTENGMRGSTKGRAKAVLRARKWARYRLGRYFNVLNKHRVTRNEKMRIFDKMDEVVDLRGQLARVNYILRKEKPVGKVKRDYLKEKKIAKRDIRILKKSIERSTIRVLKRARKREKQMRAMYLAYGVLGAILLFVVGMILMGPQILEASKLILPVNFHKYIDIILKHWPL